MRSRDVFITRRGKHDGLHLLIGFHVASEVHMRLMDIQLCHPDFTPENPVTTLP